MRALGAGRPSIPLQVQNMKTMTYNYLDVVPVIRPLQDSPVEFEGTAQSPGLLGSSLRYITHAAYEADGTTLSPTRSQSPNLGQNAKLENIERNEGDTNDLYQGRSYGN